MVVVGQFMLLYMKYTILKTGLNRSRGRGSTCAAYVPAQISPSCGDLSVMFSVLLVWNPSTFLHISTWWDGGGMFFFYYFLFYYYYYFFNGAFSIGVDGFFLPCQCHKLKKTHKQTNIVEGCILFTNGQVWQPSTEWQPELTQQDGREKKTANLPWQTWK